jgi:hypothetical protein
MTRIDRSTSAHGSTNASAKTGSGRGASQSPASGRQLGYSGADTVESARRSTPAQRSTEPRADRFGRMFPALPPLDASPEAIAALASAMVDDGDNDNPRIPAGYTYLGQFIDHDITFDATPSSRTLVDPTQIQNFRTPALDLDNLYGGGPTTHPHLYQRRDPRLLALGMCKESVDLKGRPKLPAMPNDLPRTADHVALVGDPRDDENLIVAQTHVAFADFHNHVVQTTNATFEEARRITTWHYQWIVLHDFLPRLCGEDVIADILSNGRKFFLFDRTPYMPVEFASAAYRLGHSMVRQTYDYNRLFGPRTPETPRLTPATLPILFAFTGASSNGKAMPLPSHWSIDWRRFYDLGGGVPLNLSRKLDPYIPSALHNLPPMKMSLAQLNLARGVRMGLPSGQAVARAMGMTPLTPDEVAQGSAGAVAKQHDLVEETPLWFYVLQEASVRENGLKLGPVGARIVAEVFIGLLQADKNAFADGWQPTMGAVAGQFAMADMLRAVGKLNPIGDG